MPGRDPGDLGARAEGLPLAQPGPTALVGEQDRTVAGGPFHVESGVGDHRANVRTLAIGFARPTGDSFPAKARSHSSGTKL